VSEPWTGARKRASGAMGHSMRIRARAGLLLPLLCIPVLLASCSSEVDELTHDERGKIDSPSEILEEYPDLAHVLVSARDYLRENTQELLASSAPPIAEEGEYEGKVMVFGAVGKPAILPLEPGARLTWAISHAGGLRPGANGRCVFVIRRRSCLDDSRIIHVDYVGILKYADLAQDLPLSPKDVVYVPPEDRPRRVYMDPIGEYLRREIPLHRLVNLLEKLRP